MLKLQGSHHKLLALLQSRFQLFPLPYIVVIAMLLVLLLGLLLPPPLLLLGAGRTLPLQEGHIRAQRAERTDLLQR